MWRIETALADHQLEQLQQLKDALGGAALSSQANNIVAVGMQHTQGLLYSQML